ncbi:TIGR02285 family protein [Neptuniibacter caesariensis]|nr:TIGR02285 family protein [Neptuniibacter caesariensis]
MGKLISRLLICLSLLSIPALHMQAHGHDSPEKHQDVTWSRTDFAPFFILEGAFINQGVSDEIIRLLISKLPDYEHHVSDMSLKRMLKSAESGMPICHVALLITPERQKFIDYSDAIMRNYGNGIITTKAGLSRFKLSPDTIQPIDLEQLTHTPVSISIHDGRAYSPYIDKVIKENLGKPNSIFHKKTGLQEQNRLFERLLSQRLDGLIARPEEAEFSKRMLGFEDDLYYIPIQNSPATSLAYVGCAKGDWNNQLIADLNQLIKTDVEVQKTVSQAYRQWLPTHLQTKFDSIKDVTVPKP